MIHLVLTAEHAGNEIPERYADYFRSPDARAALDSHRGWDPGSIEIAESFSDFFDVPVQTQRVSRLLVECNRSSDHPALWSEFSAPMPEPLRQEVLTRYWLPHREAVRSAVAGAPSGATVVHVGVHTFTPVWKGRPRATKIGILYDHRRPGEAVFAAGWQAKLKAEPAIRGLAVHRNRPYRGWTDGLVTSLRAEFSNERYIGIELEVAQGIVLPRPAGARRRETRVSAASVSPFTAALCSSLDAALAELAGPSGPQRPAMKSTTSADV